MSSIDGAGFAGVSPGGFAGVSDDAITVGLADLHEMHTDTIRSMLALIAALRRPSRHQSGGESVPRRVGSLR